MRNAIYMYNHGSEHKSIVIPMIHPDDTIISTVEKIFDSTSGRTLNENICSDYEYRRLLERNSVQYIQ